MSGSGGDSAPARPRLSKSRFISGRQCHLRLWYETYERHLATPPDESLQAAFEIGHEVGAAARERYPGGCLIAQDHLHIPQALEKTRQAIEADTAPALFEAAVLHEGVLVRADVLERLHGGGWRLVEVKAATRLKGVFVADLAVQLWVLRGAGLDIRDAGVLTLDRTYVYDGRTLDRDALFRLHPLFAKACALGDGIGEEARAMQAMLAGRRAPDIAPGGQCFAPYLCPFHAHCTRDAAPRDERAAAELEDVREASETVPPGAPAARTATPAVRRGTADALAGMALPVRHLDFETWAPAIPQFAGTRPYDAVPFLFSVHTETDGDSPTHTDYLHEGGDDPRPHLAERLIEALGRAGTICTYSDYERRILRALAAALPTRAGDLAAIEARLCDLLEIVRGGYSHPAFRGSLSIKSVLPALAPEYSYDDLEIADGWMASVRYRQALASEDPGLRRRMFDDLRAYCARDTLATVVLRRALLSADQSSGRSP